MSNEPSIPKPTPEIPRGRLWSCLAIPPAITLLANGMISLLWRSGEQAFASLGVPVLMFFVLVGFTQLFHDTVKNRYQGRSLVFLNFAYFLGQVIVCLALWFGSCVLFLPPPSLH